MNSVLHHTLMYLQENATDEFQMTKVCLCEIIKNQLHDGNTSCVHG